MSRGVAGEGRRAGTSAADSAKDVGGGERREVLRRQVLSELNAALQVHSHRMRLQRKTGGLDSRNDGRIGESDVATGRESQLQVAVALLPQVSAAAASSSRIPTLHKRAQQRKQPPALAALRVPRPDYTWNRGGRLKEIRIRTVARKFLDAWKMKTFGKVLPSVARLYYNRKIVRAAFNEWSDLWWTVRKEWRLRVRAECHDRYRLWARTWKAWRLYTVSRRLKTAAIKRARSHHNATCVRFAWRSWLQHVVHQKTKAADHKRAIALRSHCLVRTFWNKWVACLENRRLVSLEDQRALSVWATSLTQKFWVRWRTAFAQRSRDQVQQRRASVHCEKRLKNLAWAAWLSFVEERRRKTAVKADVDKLHSRSLQQRYIGLWQQRFAAAVAIASLEDQILAMARRATLRRVFIIWRFYIQLKRNRQRVMEDAAKHCDHRLMKTAFAGMRYLVVAQRIKSLRNALADRFHTRQVIVHAWANWVTKYDRNQELLLYPKTKRALQHYEMSLARRTLKTWKEYCTLRRLRKEELLRAEAFFYWSAVPLCFARWRTYVDLTKWKVHASQVADDTYRQKLLSQFFYHWLHQQQCAAEQREMERMAILQYESAVQVRFLRLWRVKTESKLEATENTIVACQHYERCLCLKTIAKLKAEVFLSKQQNASFIKATIHEKRKKMRQALCTWSQYVLTRKKQRALLAKARDFYGRTLIRKVYRAWFAFWQMERQMHCRALDVIRSRDVAHIKIRWQQWQHFVAYKKLRKQKMKQAVLFHQRHSLAVVLHCWREISARLALARLEDNFKTERLRGATDSALLNRCFATWRLARDRRLLERLKYQQAVEYRSRKLASFLLNGWRAHTKLEQRKKILARQATIANNVRIVAGSFVAWKEQLHTKREQQAKDAVALWQWSLVLERKCLAAWFAYAKDCRRKKNRYEAALAYRQQWLVRECAQRWLAAASYMHTTRTKLAAQRRAEGAFDLFQVVMRCFLHWREWTARRRGQQRPAPAVAAAAACNGATSSFGVRAAAVPKAIQATSLFTTSSASCSASAASHGVLTKSRVRSPDASGTSLASCVTPPRRRPRPQPRLPAFLMQSLDGLDLAGFSASARASIAASQTRSRSDCETQPKQQQEHQQQLRPVPSRIEPDGSNPAGLARHRAAEDASSHAGRPQVNPDGRLAAADEPPLKTDCRRLPTSRTLAGSEPSAMLVPRLLLPSSSFTPESGMLPVMLPGIAVESASSAAAAACHQVELSGTRRPSEQCDLVEPRPTTGWRPVLRLLPPDAFSVSPKQPVPLADGRAAGDAADTASVTSLLPSRQLTSCRTRQAEIETLNAAYAAGDGPTAAMPRASTATAPTAAAIGPSRKQLLEFQEKMVALRDAKALLRKKEKRMKKLCDLVHSCSEPDFGDTFAEISSEVTVLQAEAEELARDIERMTADCRTLALSMRLIH